jgi:hypothetical protein
MKDGAWARVGKAVKARREALGLPQGVGGVSSATWRKVEGAIDPPYRPATLAKIARALDWQADAFDRLLAGKEPAITEAPETYTFTAEQVEALFNRVHGVVKRLDALEAIVHELIQLDAEGSDDEPAQAQPR